MGVISQSASRHFEIEDRWLDQYSNDGDRYVDLDEVRKSTATNIKSQYLSDLISMGIISLSDVDKVAARADFIINGIHIGDDGDLRGTMLDEAYRDTWTLSQSVTHPLRFRRVWSRYTTARGIKILGYRGNA